MRVNSYQLPSYQNNFIRLSPLLSFGYYGGKWRMSSRIADFLDYKNTTTYIEPFGGSAAVLLNKTPHDTEIYIEKSLSLCSFWKCMGDKDNALKLLDRLYDSEYDKEEFECCCNIVNVAEASKEYLKDLSDDKVLDIAAACFIVFSFSRDSAGLRFRDRKKKHTAYLKSVDRLIEVADRFNGVEVLHGDALDLLCGDRFNSSDIMVYLDPVYLSKTGGKDSRSHTLYRYQFGYAEHMKLLECVRTMQSKILLSGYDDDSRLYDRYLINGEGGTRACKSFRPWKRYEFEAVSAVGRGEKTRIEVLWSNYG